VRETLQVNLPKLKIVPLEVILFLLQLFLDQRIMMKIKRFLRPHRKVFEIKAAKKVSLRLMETK
jgi:hypothetical protein